MSNNNNKNNALPNSNATGAKPPKGHRQRGAGTVVVSKGDVKRDGLVVKDWQKTPKQLLSDYCRANKRPLPNYHTILSKNDKFLVRVILPDPKNDAEKNIVVSTKDPLPSLLEAEHGSALLALSKVDGARQYEKKLPPPFDLLWLKLVGRERTGGEEEEEEELPYVCTICNKSFAKDFALAQHVKTEHPKPKNVNNIATESGGNNNNNSVALLGEEKNTPPPTPSPPPAAALATKFVASASLLQIESKGHFLNEKERRLAMEAKMEKQRDRERRDKERKEQNEGFPILMSEDNRKMIEDVCKEEKQKEMEFLQTHHHHQSNTNNERELYGTLVNKFGFLESDVRLALEENEGRANSVSDLLDWLCLHLPEERLPMKSFDPRSFQVELVVQQKKNENNNNNAFDFRKFHVVGEFSQWFLEVFEQAIEMNRFTHETPNEEVENEILTTQAILGDEAMVRINKAALQLKIPEKPTTSVVFLFGGDYPTVPPLVFYHSNVNNVHVEGSKFLQTQLEEKKGETGLVFFIYEIAKQENFLELVASNKRTEASSWFTSSTAPTTQNNNNKSRHARSNNNKTPHQDNAELIKRFESIQTKETYVKMCKVRQTLPAYQLRGNILSQIATNQITLVKGETGSGKTTQVPQFVLEEALTTKQSNIHIICTQPRRIAAVGVATRVAEEMGQDKVGDLVGYRVQLDSCVSRNTRLEFVTTGVLLRRLIDDGRLSGVTHVFVDECHERSVEIDFLLACLKILLAGARQDLKLVLMSATYDTELFEKYFSFSKTFGRLQIPGRTFPVQTMYWNEFMRKIKKPTDEFDDGEFANTMEAKICLAVSFACEELNKLERMEGEKKKTTRGSILVFVSGVGEIRSAMTALNKLDNSNELVLLPLHGSLPPHDQKLIFQHVGDAKRKVIVSTNVAETSITIDDCVFVIDTGRMKEAQFDPETKMSSLVDVWVSKANAKQRRGRSGRVREGFCIHLWEETKVKLLEHQVPEIHRVPLDQLCLQVSGLKHKVKDFLLNLIEPPSVRAIEKSIWVLKNEIHAFAEDETLNGLGKVLLQLPLDVHLGKMLVYGSLLGCFEEICVIAASLSRRNPFLNPSPENRAEFDVVRKRMRDFGVANSGQSDHLILCSAFALWKQCGKSEREKRKFANENFLSFDGMREIGLLVVEFKRLFESINLYQENGSIVQDVRRKRQLIKAAMCCSLYPRIVKIKLPPKRYAETSGGNVAVLPSSKELKFCDYNGMENVMVKKVEEEVGGEKEEEEDNEEEQEEEIAMEKRPYQRVFIHPSSINFSENNFRCPFLIYNEKIQTSKIFLREVTCPNPYGLLLFCGELKIDYESGSIAIDGLYKFKCSAKVAVLIKELRIRLNRILELKIQAPDVDFDNHPVILAMRKLIEGEGFS